MVNTPMTIFSASCPRPYQLGKRCRPILGHSSAMGEGTRISLEDEFHKLRDGSQTSVLAEILLYHPGAHVCRSALGGQIFRTDACLDKSKSTFTLLDATFTTINGVKWLKQVETTRCYHHATLSATSFKQTVEVCSGIGAVGVGFAALGVETVCYCDLNPTFCSWLRSKFGGTKTVIQGDVSEHRVIHEIAKSADQPCILTAGIACQPYSYLGDRREGLDERSESLPSTLKLGYFSRAPIIVLECTQGAMHSTYVQSILREFTSKTRYKMSQTVLHLNHTWPSHRTRWWCVLSYPFLGVQDIPRMPKLDIDLHVSHLMQIQPLLDDETMKQLTLTSRESWLFHSQKDGITKSLINTNATMPTATHSWGSQLQGCKCGCRKSGFSEERLRSKGLYGILVPLGSTYIENDKVLHNLRHPDPREMALLVGLSPSYLITKDSYDLRFLMAGVGQCASPLQGAWVLGNVLQNLNRLGDEFDFPDPYRVIANIGHDLTEERFQHWSNQEHNIKTKVFVDQLAKLARRNHPKDRETDAFSLIKYPCLDLEDDNRDCTEHVPPFVQSVQDEMLFTQTRAADLFPDAVPEPQPFSHTIPTIAPSAVHEPVHSVHSDPSIHPKPFAVGPKPSAIPKPTAAPHITCESVDVHPTCLHIPPIPYSAEGALLAFANKRKPHPQVEKTDDASLHRPEKKHREEHEGLDDNANDFPLAQHYSPTHETTTEVTDVDQVSEHDDTTNEPVVSPTQEWTQPAIADTPTQSPDTKSPISTREPGTPVHELFKPPSSKGVPCTDQLAQAIARQTIWLGLPSEPLLKLTLQDTTTLGQLTQAHTSFSNSVDYLKPLSAVGSDLALSDTAQDGQIVLLREVAFEPYRCPKTGCERQPDLTGLSRIDALWNQMGWTAVDEMDFYLNWFNKPEHPTTKPLILKGLPDDPIILGSWIMSAIENTLALGIDTKVATAIFLDDHWMPIHLEVSFTESQLTIFTTSSDLITIKNLTSTAFGDFDFDIKAVPMLSQFPADCGFQTLAFIVGKGLGDDCPKPITPTQATDWRRMFAGHLHGLDKAQDIVLSIRLGGMPEQPQHRDLIQLLEAHGVAKQRSAALAQQLQQATGHSGIQATLSSNRQWRDLKAKATACRPPIQLVMDDELRPRLRNGDKKARHGGENKPNPKQTTDLHHHSKFTSVPIRFKSQMAFSNRMMESRSTRSHCTSFDREAEESQYWTKKMHNRFCSWKSH